MIYINATCDGTNFPSAISEYNACAGIAILQEIVDAQMIGTLNEATLFTTWKYETE